MRRSRDFRLGIRLAIIAGLGCGLPLPASAQNEQAHLDIAQCVVDNDLRNVRTMLDTAPGSAAEKRAAKPVIEMYGACSDNRVAIGEFTWRERAEIAHAAARERLGSGTADTSGWASAAMGPHSAAAAAGQDAVALGLYHFGACVVRAQPRASLDLLLSSPGSGDEASAVAGIQSALGGCLIEGQKFELKRRDLRFLLAEPIYQLLVAGGSGR